MQLLKIRKTTVGKVDQAKCVISIFCLLSDIKLSDAELTVLAYFCVYKDNEVAKDLILKGDVFKTADSLRNTISKLKNIGLLKKGANKEYIVHERLNFNVEPVIGFVIKIDNK